MELKGRYIIPIYDNRGRLVGVSGRVSWETKQRKYLIYPKKLQKRNLLYNLHNISVDRVVVTEGFKGVWRAYQAGVPAVAIMGRELHDNQADILLSRFKNIVLAPDMDVHGVEGMIKAAEKLSPFAKVRFIELPLEKDLGDVSEKEILDSEALDVSLLESRLELFKER